MGGFFSRLLVRLPARVERPGAAVQEVVAAVTEIMARGGGRLAVPGDAEVDAEDRVEFAVSSTAKSPTWVAIDGRFFGEGFTKRLSRELDCPVVSEHVHDGEVAVAELYVKGRRLNAWSSDERSEPADASRWAKALGLASAEPLEQVFRRRGDAEVVPEPLEDALGRPELSEAGEVDPIRGLDEVVQSARKEHRPQLIEALFDHRHLERPPRATLVSALAMSGPSAEKRVAELLHDASRHAPEEQVTESLLFIS